MILQPVAFEPLHWPPPATLNSLNMLITDRVPEDWQATMLLPIGADWAGDTEAGLGEAALAGCACRAHHQHQPKRQYQQYRAAHSWTKDNFWDVEYIVYPFFTGTRNVTPAEWLRMPSRLGGPTEPTA